MITVRVILFPVFVKQIRSQRAMQALQPKMKELQEKHKGDQETLQQEMMELYQTEKVNPLMGCLPMFLQIPIFLGLFHVLKRLNPANPQHETLYGWTAGAVRQRGQREAVRRAHRRRSSARPPTSWPARRQRDHRKIVAGVLVLIMMATTFLTSRQMILKTGWSEDPQQRMIQKLMLYGIPVSLLDLRLGLPDRCDHLLGHQEPVLARPAVLGAAQVPAAGDRQRQGRARPAATRNPVQPAKSGGLFGRGKTAP